MARMILLGVGTAVPDIDRAHTHMVWDGPGGPLLIDAGGSTYQRLLQAGIDPQALQGVLLTHSHTDHINGLPALLFSMALAGRTELLPIYGLEPTLTLVENILGAFQLGEYTTPVSWKRLQAGDVVVLDRKTDWVMRTALTDHPRPCLALRFEETSSNLALTYSCDTAPSLNIRNLARDSTILIHEATTPEPFKGHTTPRQAGEIAAQANVERLVLVHFSPHWTMPEAQALAAIRAGGFTGQAEVGQEYQVLELK